MGFAAGFEPSIPWRVERARFNRRMAGVGSGVALCALLVLGAALAQRLGQAHVLTALGDATDPAAQLAALHLAPHLPDAELALTPLARLAAGRDPELAAPAAQRLVRISQALVRARAGSRELLPSELEPAQAALRALAQDATARADIRLYAGQAAQLLGTLGVVAAAPSLDPPSTARAP